ncbi:methyltransferase [Kitasatospora viridis]|uniref:Ribosomal RNA large subunit methyltransferase G n=1 Tax=Kitasatospora viridis TaxID=281105 RepID=A0A561UAQ5_9ACTN|nr:methyltransferase [Kitasatospora viridis]TWF96435.1 16S rRNA (guanine1207-N2)-methyltransferase [Kitasatospora viridis]
MNLFTTARGELRLSRYPEDPREQLRAWDAADEYLLNHLYGAADPDLLPPDTPPADPAGEVVVLGDRWGALTTSLSTGGAATPTEPRPTLVTDSHLAREATRANLARNGADPAAARLLASTDPAPWGPHPAEGPGRIDLLLVRVPKSLAFLEDQLHRLAPALHPGSVVIGTGMVTEIHTSTLQLFERIIGPTRTSKAVRKARLIFSTPGVETRPANPWPLRHHLPEGIGVLSGRPVTNVAGVFCADRLDIGTRFLLEHLAVRPGPLQVVDLGCGNGILGTAAALANPQAAVTFVDESFPALASAEATFRENAGPDAAATFLAADGLGPDAVAAVPPGSVDLVLNNPPFHSHQATTDATAWRMFTGARRALRPGGELWVVGNRHLGYHVKLRRIFGNCQTVAGNPKFTVLRAVKR